MCYFCIYLALFVVTESSYQEEAILKTNLFHFGNVSGKLTNQSSRYKTFQIIDQSALRNRDIPRNPHRHA